MTLFSIVMNIYNGEDYLRDSIGSVLAQTCGDWELILWDDCSKDGSAAICASYADPRIRTFLMTENGGLGQARNGAVAEARGEWVAFLDQDDVWLPDKLAMQQHLILADPYGRLGLVYGRTLRFGSQGGEAPFDPWFAPGRLPEGDVFTRLLAKPSFICISSAAFRTAALRRLGPVPASIRFCTDYYLSLMVSRDHGAACVQDVCCRYRMHGANMSHVHRRAIHEEIITIVEQAAHPAQRGVVRHRRKVHQTWIGLDEIRSGQRRSGIARILRQGSLAYLALRPLVVRMRTLRDRIRATA